MRSQAKTGLFSILFCGNQFRLLTCGYMTFALFIPRSPLATMSLLLESYKERHMNHREARQANYHYYMHLANVYSRLARRWYYSPKYTLDEKYTMCLEADAIADMHRETARALVLS
jgi:hypothetical protein